MTEQEKLELQRAAFIRGANTVKVLTDDAIIERAKLAFPDPPEPREIDWHGTRFRCVDGRLVFWHSPTKRWDDNGPYSAISTEGVRALHDLLEHPNA